MGLPLLPRGVVWTDVLLGAQGLVQRTGFQRGEVADEQEVLDGSAWCLPFGSSRWKKMKSCGLASGATSSKVEISV